MRVYLAARYSRIEELRGYREQLRAIGPGGPSGTTPVYVTSRWLNGDHQWIDPTGAGSHEAPTEERVRFAQEDTEDLMSSNLVICYTEEPRATNTRGGRHVEFGMALAAGLYVAVVGPRENVFYCLPEVFWFAEWEPCLAWVEEWHLRNRPPKIDLDSDMPPSWSAFAGHHEPVDNVITVTKVFNGIVTYSDGSTRDLRTRR